MTVRNRHLRKNKDLRRRIYKHTMTHPQITIERPEEFTQSRQDAKESSFEAGGTGPTWLHSRIDTRRTWREHADDGQSGRETHAETRSRRGTHAGNETRITTCQSSQSSLTEAG